MMQRFPLSSFVLAAVTALCGPASGGTLSSGQWAASGCGKEPAPPAIESGSADAYNRSLKLVREWQPKAQAYNNCVVQDANADNEVIAKAANAQQARFKAAVNEIQTKATEIKAKLDRQ